MGYLGLSYSTVNFFIIIFFSCYYFDLKGNLVYDLNNKLKLPFISYY
jgi:hypothetical protein